MSDRVLIIPMPYAIRIAILSDDGSDTVAFDKHMTCAEMDTLARRIDEARMAMFDDKMKLN